MKTIGHFWFFVKNKTEDPSVKYAGQGYVRFLNAIK